MSSAAHQELALLVLTLALSATFVVVWQDSALACRGIRNWSTGADLSKLKAGEIVVNAMLLESYKSERKVDYSIMGLSHGYVYYVHVVEVVGSADAAIGDLRDLRDAKIFILLNPSICEQYFPDSFTKDARKTLVLKKGHTGLYDLVGGQE